MLEASPGRIRRRGLNTIARFAVAPTRWAGFAVALAHGLGVDAQHIEWALRD